MNAAPQEAILSFCLCGPLKKKEGKIRRGENGSSRFPRKLQGDATSCVVLVRSTKEKKGLNQHCKTTYHLQTSHNTFLSLSTKRKMPFSGNSSTDRLPRLAFIFALLFGKKANGTFPRFAAGLHTRRTLSLLFIFPSLPSFLCTKTLLPVQKTELFSHPTK